MNAMASIFPKFVLYSLDKTFFTNNSHVLTSHKSKTMLLALTPKTMVTALTPSSVILLF